MHHYLEREVDVVKQALLVIDAQKIYSLETSGYYVSDVEAELQNINALIDSFEKRGDLIIYVKHIHAVDGSDAGRMFDFAGDEVEGVEFAEGSEEAEFIDTLKVVEGSPIIVKKRYDSFIDTDLEKILIDHCIEKVTICGFMTNFCCDSTARHAHDIGYYVDFVVDATGTPGTELLSAEEIKKATVANMTEGFAVVINTNDIV